LAEGFTRFSAATARRAGSAWAFGAAAIALLGWLASGPVFHWSTGWQSLATTATALITFLMVFVIQATQNRHSAAMQLKLDELIHATEKANGELIGADQLSQSEIEGHRGALEEREA
jgi:low affinity Fe/Cu permease